MSGETADNPSPNAVDSAGILTGERVPERVPRIAWQAHQGEMIVLHLDRQEMFGLNAVGRRVWELVDGTRSIDAIVQAVASEFDVAAAAARADVAAFLAELIALRMVALLPDGSRGSSGPSPDGEEADAQPVRGTPAPGR